MKRFLIVLPSALLAMACTLLPNAQHEASAQSSSSSKVQGVVPSGSTAPVGSINPVLMGAANVTSLHVLRCSPAGDLYLAALTSGSSTTTFLTDPAGALFTRSSAINPALDTPTRVNVTSNGTANVSLVGVSGTKAVYVGSLLFLNAITATVTHKITVTSTGGTLVAVFTVPAGVTGTLGEDGGMYSTPGGEGLQFSIDNLGAASDVTVSGVCYQK